MDILNDYGVIMKTVFTKKDLKKPGPGSKELEACKDCAEYGGEFCDVCLDEQNKLKNKKFIFDVDGTLTPSREKINREFKNFFVRFCIDNHVSLVTGSDYEKTEEQLGPIICKTVNKLYNCSGNEVRSLGKIVKTEKWIPQKNLLEHLQNILDNNTFSMKTGNHIEYRPSSINFSVVGRNANMVERKIYVVHDERENERVIIANQINDKFSDVQAVVGGETGIDIFPRGKDKSQIINDFDPHDNLIFFGDKMSPVGNDYSLSLEVVNRGGTIHHVKDWQQTWKILTSIFQDQ